MADESKHDASASTRPAAAHLDPAAVHNALNYLAAEFPEQAHLIKQHREKLARAILLGEDFPELHGIAHPAAAAEPHALALQASLAVGKSTLGCVTAVGKAVFGAVKLLLDLLHLPDLGDGPQIVANSLSSLGPAMKAFLMEELSKIGELIATKNAVKVAHSVWELVESVYNAGMFGAMWAAYKRELTSWSWFKWVTTVGVAVAQLAVWFASGATALIAQLALMAHSMYELLGDINEIGPACSGEPVVPKSKVDLLDWIGDYATNVRWFGDGYHLTITSADEIVMAGVKITATYDEATQTLSWTNQGPFFPPKNFYTNGHITFVKGTCGGPNTFHGITQGVGSGPIDYTGHEVPMNLRKWAGDYTTNVKWWGDSFHMTIGGDGSIKMGGHVITVTYSDDVSVLAFRGATAHKASGEIQFSVVGGKKTFKGEIHPRPQDGPLSYTGTA